MRKKNSPMQFGIFKKKYNNGKLIFGLRYPFLEDESIDAEMTNCKVCEIIGQKLCRRRDWKIRKSDQKTPFLPVLRRSQYFFLCKFFLPIFVSDETETKDLNERTFRGGSKAADVKECSTSFEGFKRGCSYLRTNWLPIFDGVIFNNACVDLPAGVFLRDMGRIQFLEP